MSVAETNAIERAAIALAAAFHAGRGPVVAWADLTDDERKAWRVVARLPPVLEVA